MGSWRRIWLRQAGTLAALVMALLSIFAATASGTAGGKHGLQAAAVQASSRQLPQPVWSAPHVPGQLLVKLPEPQAARTAASARAALAGSGVRVLRTVPQLGLVLVETLSGTDSLEATAADLIERSAAEWAEPNYTFGLDADAPRGRAASADLIPNDPDYLPRQEAYLGKRLQMPAAWDVTIGHPNIVVAIVDTGVDITHPDLAGGIWTNPREVPGNGVDDDGNGFVDDVHGWNFPDDSNVIYDDYGHGTHVAGIAGARINNGIGIAGMAGGATLMPVDVFPRSGYGTYDDLIRAIIYATDNGARVINLSLGATSYSRGEEAAVNYAWSHGVVVVAAAGNSGREAVHYPAAHAHAIAVAATDSSDSLASFSTRGNFVDVAAPGVSVWSTFPGGQYGRLSGTSMATPHVAGLAALILSRNAGLGPDQVRALIEGTADDRGAVGWDPAYGHGRIQAARALAKTPAGSEPPSPPGSLPPLTEWPASCRDLIAEGDFEAGLGPWQAKGDVSVDSTRAYSGSYAVHFAGGAGTSGTLSLTLDLPAFPVEATLWFAYRIENKDQGWGSSPEAPYDDWLTADLRTQDGWPIMALLRTGNSADTATDGLPWDRYLYRMRAIDLSALRGRPVSLVFTAFNDSDSLPTDFWIDAVRFCVRDGYGVMFPWASKWDR